MTTNQAHVLLIQDAQGVTLAVRFASAEDARDWEDEHPEVVALGCAPLIPRNVALKAS